MLSMGSPRGQADRGGRGPGLPEPSLDSAWPVFQGGPEFAFCSETGYTLLSPISGCVLTNHKAVFFGELGDARRPRDSLRILLPDATRSSAQSVRSEK